jgi:hypothetical protein
MMRDPSPADLRELGVGLATFADLGLDPETLSPEERARYGAALSRTALIAPDAIRFTQRSVSPQTSDGTSAQDLVGNMRDGGWRGGPVHGVRWGDGSVSSLDNRRLRAARRAGLDVVPFVVHGPSDRLADWPQEWSPARQRRAALGVDIIELADGSWVAGGAEGRTVYAKGTVPQTFGDIALFRAAEQRSLLPGHLFGADREPVLLGRPPDPTRPVQLREADQRILDDLRLRAEAAAGQVQHDLAEVGQAVTAALGLGETIDLYGQEHRVKGAESLARKYADEGRSEGIPAAEFAHQINDVLRFSLVLPPGEDYRPAVDRVLAELRQLDYQIDPESVKNFWGVGNRFYGLNCTLTSPDGQTFELQLPTEASRRVGKLTHEPYEILRRKNELAPRRVHAFLRMLEINKRYGMTGAIPPDLDAAFGVKDATFAKWILGESTVWRDYRAWLDLNGRSFAEIVAEFGLVVADFPVSARVAAELEDADVGLLRALPDGREDDPVRDLRDGPRRARVDLGSLGQGVVVQPVAGGADRGRLPELRPLPDSGSGDGGADRASGDRRGAGSGRGVDQLGVPVGGQPTPERRLTDAEAQAESRPDRKAIPEPRLRDGREQAHEHRLDPRLPVEAVVATAPRLAAVFAAGVTPAEAAGQLDQTNLRRLVPRLGEAEAGDIARFLADSRVQQMLDNAWRTPPRAEPMLAEKLLGQLTERVGLVRMIQETPTLANSLTARPLTLHHLASQQEAIDVLASVLDDIATQGAAAVAAEPMSRPEPTRLQAWQVAVSASIEVPEEDDLQPGFDQRKKDDPIYRAAYLNRLYADAEPAQRELMALARRLSNEGQPGGGKPGWRKKLKDRARAEDKIAGYQGLADRLRDIAGAKIEFQNLGDLYAALDRLRLDPTVTIVQFSDRFREPQRSGYRDIQLMLRTSNGHIAEFRLHQAALDEVAVWEHALFEVRRDIEAIAEQEGRAMTATERAIRDGVMREEQSQFWQALRSTIPEVR